LAAGAPLVGALVGRESAFAQGTHKGCPCGLLVLDLQLNALTDTIYLP
jgi:hypothetical protein